MKCRVTKDVDSVGVCSVFQQPGRRQKVATAGSLRVRPELSRACVFSGIVTRFQHTHLVQQRRLRAPRRLVDVARLAQAFQLVHVIKLDQLEKRGAGRRGVLFRRQAGACEGEGER